MKKIILLSLLFVFNFLLFSQEKEELSNYEKYRIEKEKQDHPSLYSQDTVFIVDTVYLEEEKPKSFIYNNYYINDNIRYRYLWNYSQWDNPWNSWYYPYWNAFYVHGYYRHYYGYYGYYSGFYQHYNSYYWNVPRYYRSYYNSRYRNGVIKHRKTHDPYRNYSTYNRSNIKTTTIVHKKPRKINKTVYLDRNTRRNISNVNRSKVNRTPTYSKRTNRTQQYNPSRRTTINRNSNSRQSSTNRNSNSYRTTQSRSYSTPSRASTSSRSVSNNSSGNSRSSSKGSSSSRRR